MPLAMEVPSPNIGHHWQMQPWPLTRTRGSIDEAFQKYGYPNKWLVYVNVNSTIEGNVYHLPIFTLATGVVSVISRARHHCLPSLHSTYCDAFAISRGMLGLCNCMPVEHFTSYSGWMRQKKQHKTHHYHHHHQQNNNHDGDHNNHGHDTTTMTARTIATTTQLTKQLSIIKTIIRNHTHQ